MKGGNLLSRKKWINPLAVGIMWVLLFVGILAVSRRVYYYSDHLLGVGITIAVIILSASIVYLISMKLMGRHFMISINKTALLGYGCSGLSLVLCFYAMSIVFSEMQAAAEIMDIDRVNRLRGMYTILGVAAGGGATGKAF
jgi:hypothetical protein